MIIMYESNLGSYFYCSLILIRYKLMIVSEPDHMNIKNDTLSDRFFFHLTCLLLLGLMPTSHALAHHGIYNFDLNKDIELKGEITDVAFINPHS
jgi:hypothetical protein